MCFLFLVIFFFPAHFLVRVQYIIHVTYTYVFVVYVIGRAFVPGRLSVVRFQRRQK